MHADQRRVLVIGLDAATFDLIDPWVAQGYLPNLARLKAAGTHGLLASTLQPATAPAWVTAMTGVNQGQHGLYDFVRRRPDSYAVEVTNATHVGAPTIFELLSRVGRRVVSVNVPYTFPPRPVNGVMLGGPFAPGVTPGIVYPRSFYDTLKVLVPDYFILPDYDPQASDPLGRFAETLLLEIEQRERVSLHLMSAEPWDLFMVVFMAADEAHHSFWACMQAPDGDPAARYRDVIRRIYQRLDEAVGRLVAEASANGQPEPAVLVVSDHGAGPFRGMINLNHWLVQAGLFRFRVDRVSRLMRVRAGLLEQAAYRYRRHVPSGLRSSVRNRIGARRLTELKGELQSAGVMSAVDWSQTKAYALGVGGNIYLNLKGREPEGIVGAGAEYDQTCDAIAQGLATLKDPDSGQLIVRQVHRRADVYHGSFLEHAPDLIVEWSDYAYWGRGSFDRPDTPIFQAQRRFDFSDQPLSGSHRQAGILIAYGAGIQSGARVEGAHLSDLAPTIMRLLNIEPPAAFDGQVLAALLAVPDSASPEQSLQTAPAAQAEAFEYTEDEAQQIMEHLRSLGYF